mmetsp:Transcript_42135/g.70297  ORF Transcript_42135/g.70297 Transcript_42135/m.70297 type:complete len:88 (+) Transcript_42135:1344-1607(+)
MLVLLLPFSSSVIILLDDWAAFRFASVLLTGKAFEEPRMAQQQTKAPRDTPSVRNTKSLCSKKCAPERHDNYQSAFRGERIWAVPPD